MLPHIATTLACAATEVLSLFGGVFLPAVALWEVSQSIRRYASGLLGRMYYWLVAPGVVCHETGHALGCLLTGTRIHEFVPFCPAGNTLGYVSYETKPGLLWKMGQFFIATGPMWFGCAVIMLAAHLFTGEDFLSAFQALAPRPGEGVWVHCKGVWYGAIWMFQTVFAPWRWGTPLFPLFVYLVFCVASEITLSPPDLAGMWKGFAAIAAGLFLLNLVPGVSEWVKCGITALRPMVFVLQTLLFFVLLADFALLGAIRLLWIVFAKNRQPPNVARD